MDVDERKRLVAWLVAEFEVQNGIDVSADANAIARLSDEAIRATQATDVYEVNIPFLAADATGPKHLHVTLAKRRLDDIRAGREGPPHVDRQRRSTPPPSRKEPREDERPSREGGFSVPLLVAIVLVVVVAVTAIAFTTSSKHHHEHDDGHGQEHKR